MSKSGLLRRSIFVGMLWLFSSCACADTSLGKLISKQQITAPKTDSSADEIDWSSRCHTIWDRDLAMADLGLIYSKLKPEYQKVVDSSLADFWSEHWKALCSLTVKAPVVDTVQDMYAWYRVETWADLMAAHWAIENKKPELVNLLASARALQLGEANAVVNYSGPALHAYLVGGPTSLDERWLSRHCLNTNQFATLYRFSQIGLPINPKRGSLASLVKDAQQAAVYDLYQITAKTRVVNLPIINVAFRSTN